MGRASGICRECSKSCTKSIGICYFCQKRKVLGSEELKVETIKEYISELLEAWRTKKTENAEQVAFSLIEALEEWLGKK